MEEITLTYTDIKIPIMPGEPKEYPSPFTTIIGSYAYGCATEKSDIDVHNVYCAPIEKFIGLKSTPASISFKTLYQSKTVEVTAHEVRKFVELLMKGNPNALDTLYSPLVINTSLAHETLKDIARGCLTKNSAMAYANMAQNQIKVVLREAPNEIKPLLHICRSALTALHLLRTQTIELNLLTLGRFYEKHYVEELVEWKKAGISEIPYVASRSEAVRQRQHIIDDLTKTVQSELDSSLLPDATSNQTEEFLHSWLVNLRLVYSNLTYSE